MTEAIITHDEANDIVQRLPDQDDRSDIVLADYVRQQRERDFRQAHRVDCGWSHDRDGRCGECVACLRAEIARLTRELAEARRLVKLQGVAQALMAEDAFAEAVEQIARVQRVRWVDCVTGEHMEAIQGSTRSAGAQGVVMFFGLLRMWTREQERDAARQERDAMKAMMPKPPYDADTLERAARGTYADRTVRGMARALLRLSPPSAPIDTRCGACIRAGRPGPCIECAYTGKAGS